MAYLGNSKADIIRQDHRYTATEGQTVFQGEDLAGNTLTFYPELYEVYVNGVMLDLVDSIGDGVKVTLSKPTSVGDVVTIRTYQNYKPRPTVDEGLLKYIYDPRNISADVFSMDNMTDGNTNKVFTNTDKTKLNNTVNNLGGVSNIIKLSQSEYDSLLTKDENTIYIII